MGPSTGDSGDTLFSKLIRGMDTTRTFDRGPSFDLVSVRSATIEGECPVNGRNGLPPTELLVIVHIKTNKIRILI